MEIQSVFYEVRAAFLKMTLINLMYQTVQLLAYIMFRIANLSGSAKFLVFLKLIRVTKMHTTYYLIIYSTVIN
jgi:hypothetical protein